MAAANLLWNNMLEPVGNKTTVGLDHIMERFYCPTEAAPYFFTYNNSVRFLLTGRQDWTSTAVELLYCESTTLCNYSQIYTEELWFMRAVRFWHILLGNRENLIENIIVPPLCIFACLLNIRVFQQFWISKPK